MFDILAQNGVELSVGGATVGAVAGFYAKHMLAKKGNGGKYQTKEICGIHIQQIKETLTDIKKIVEAIRDKE